MTSGSIERAQRIIPGACFGTFQLPDDVAFIVDRAEGARLWTQDGRELIDHVLGSGPMVLGHAHPRVVDAIHHQAKRGTTYYTLNEPAVELAERIGEMVPCAEGVKFLSTGSDATLYAMRLARGFTKRAKVLKFEGAYHGTNDYALQSMKPSDPASYPTPKPDCAGIPQQVSETKLVAPYNDLQTTTRIAAEESDSLAAVIVEPVQRSIEPKPGFLEGLRRLCDKFGILLIFDEVVTGFRLAPGGAQEKYGVRPDLCTLGKIIGGGLPLAAVAGRRDIVETSDPSNPESDRRVYLSGTLNGNPLAAAAGLATLDVLIEENGPKRLRDLGTHLVRHLEEAATRLSMPFQMIGPPSFAEPIFGEGEVVDYRSYLATNRKAASLFSRQMLRQGVFLASKAYVSIAHNDLLLERVVTAGEAALKQVRNTSFVPPNSSQS